MRTLTTEIVGKEGQSAELIGWVHTRRDHGKLIFIDLRDRNGIAQIVFSGALAAGEAGKLRPEWVIKVTGEVKKRPANMENPNLVTGKVEVAAQKLEIIAEAKTPPIALDTAGTEIGEEVRMKYRYLDLRRERLQKNLRNRAKVIQFIRGFLAERDFVEIETPILGKSTPEGARDYLVPARLYPGKFYALPQSPQQYKQLLMVAGFERYFQIARCFRDEDTRGDRQPEFTQLDIEMSFAEEEDILKLIEELYVSIVKTLYPQKKIQQVPFPRLSYKEVMEKYDSDKPDLRKNPSTGSGQADPNELAFAFVVDFPMFEWKETEKRWDAVHHPFTRVKSPRSKVQNENERIAYIRENPKELLAHQYDFVLNGYEIGGGSIRETNPRVLQAVFEIMGNKPEDVREQFGHMLEAFDYGAPPHGGIAPGLDRFMMILENEPNIREVIAFPKTGDGRDLMMNAPSEVSREQLKELKIKFEK